MNGYFIHRPVGVSLIPCIFEERELSPEEKEKNRQLNRLISCMDRVSNGIDLLQQLSLVGSFGWLVGILITILGHGSLPFITYMLVALITYSPMLLMLGIMGILKLVERHLESKLKRL